MANYPASTDLGLTAIPEGRFQNDPDHTDRHNDEATAMQQIATTLGANPQQGYSDVSMRLTAMQGSLNTQSGRIGELEGGDVEYFTRGEQPDAAPWRDRGFQIVRSGNVMTFRYQFTRSDAGAVVTGGAADVIVNTRGQMTTQVVGYVPSQFRGNFAQPMPIAGYGSRLISGSYRSNTGEIVMTNATGEGTIALGEVFYIGGTVMIGTN